MDFGSSTASPLNKVARERASSHFFSSAIECLALCVALACILMRKKLQKMTGVAATHGLPDILPTLGRTALRRAQRRFSLLCLKAGAVAAAAATAKTTVTAASGVFCNLCGVWTPLPYSQLVPSEPSSYTAPSARKTFAPTLADLVINSPKVSEDGWAPINANPIDAGNTAAAAPIPPERLWNLDVNIGSEGANIMHASIFSDLPVGSSPQKRMKRYCFQRSLRHVDSGQYSTDQNTGECKTQ